MEQMITMNDEAIVTVVGNTRRQNQVSVTRDYEDWELPFVKNTQGHTYHKLCKLCGLEIVGQPSYKNRMLYTPMGSICYPCRREASRLKRLSKRQESRRKLCGQCGEDFIATRADAKFCSAKCKQKHHRNK